MTLQERIDKDRRQTDLTPLRERRVAQRRIAAMRLAIAKVAFRQAQVQAQTERNIARLVAVA